ncbi:MAG: CotH kinase family protein [Firmicutes bacterium]|nr:CotH kinase family protein [Bacillota bacterium]
MKKLTKIIIILVCLLLVMIPIIGCLETSSDNSELLDKIADLENRLRDLENERDEGNQEIARLLALLQNNSTDIDLLQATVDALQAHLNNALANLGAANQNITALQAALDAANARIRELQDELYELTGIPTGHRIGDFALSHAPGVFSEGFDLEIRHINPAAVIYYTIDGTDPTPGANRFISRNTPSTTSIVPWWTNRENGNIQVSGRVPESGLMPVRDNTVSHWHWYSILSRHTANTTGYGTGGGTPAPSTYLRQGTAFRFRAFLGNTPASEIITTTFLVWEDFSDIFGDMPIIAVTAAYSEFLDVYRDTSPQSNIQFPAQRRIFNYEFFEIENGRYNRKFSMPASSQLGGRGSRGNPQRTINVHVARNELEGEITHEVFDGLESLTRFRLWNGGNSFWWCHLRDPFMQQAAFNAGGNIFRGDYRLAVKIINGEFWGFTTMREHTSNSFFTLARAGLARDNVSMVDGTWIAVPGMPPHMRYTEIQEEAGGLTMTQYTEMWEFIRDNDPRYDCVREQLFEQFVCIYNVMDYIIFNTFFGNNDWIQNNVRAFRAARPDRNSPNPYMDGRWRFILHDMDRAIPVNGTPSGSGVWGRANSFCTITYRISDRSLNHERGTWLRVLRVVNNRYFAERMRARAIHLMENGLSQQSLEALFEEFVEARRPVLATHYNRFSMTGARTVESSLSNWNAHINAMRPFFVERHGHYRNHLDAMVNRAYVGRRL